MKTKMIMILALIVLFSACSRLKIETPEFKVTTQKLNYKIGDSVRFQLSGNVDYIYFFSGEQGSEFAKKDLFENDKNGVGQLKFNTSATGVTTTANNLSVLISNDFNGTYDTTNVKNATWQDVTSLANLGSAATIDLTTYAVDGKPLYVAYKYLGDSPNTKNQKSWSVSSFSLRTTHADGEVYSNAASSAEGNFRNVEFKGDSATWTINLTSFFHRGLSAGLPGDNDWLISKGFNLRSALGDASGVTTVKNLTTGFVPSSQIKIYTKPGTYKATFIARNANIKGVKEKVVEFIITVSP